jgi:tetraether lipid synthase
MCIIPYATQEGEISFCAYNTGVGWRHIVEKMHMTATLTKWYEEHGRHRIYAGGKGVELADTDHTLTIDPDAAAAAAQTDLDELGIAKTAREEKRRARRYHERMEQLYREHVLNEEPTIQIQRPRGDDR